MVGMAAACMWDYDTLAMEAKGLPKAMRIISGRFERNPPLYYQMRLERVSKELQTKPNELSLYDDAGVAAARLGKNDEAIEWMAKKLKVLKATKEKNTDHWYRYHANLGTFYIHRWLHEGCKKERIADAKAAHNHIAEAIRINPEAHFGREYMQLRAIDGIIAVKTGKAKNLVLYNESDVKTAKQQIEGMCGLIVLGAAWESVDIFDSLAQALSSDGQASVAHLAELRRNELLDEGKKPLAGSADEMRKQKPGSLYMMATDKAKQNIEADFKMLRDEAKEYEKNRTAYMMERLKAGRHPDTDKDFWSDWTEPEPPELLAGGSGSVLRTTAVYGSPATAVAIVLLAIARKRRRAKAAN